MKYIKDKLPLIRIKLFIASILYCLLKIFYRKNVREITREGIFYEIDLAEGIDFYLFLFGNYQKHVSKNKYINLPRGATILDVGACFGFMSLQFAKLASEGNVHAFEPTDYAYDKLKRNLRLNPLLAKRIKTNKCIVSSEKQAPKDMSIYSSWKIVKSNNSRHLVHGGIKKTATGVQTISIDEYCKELNIKKVDLIKIDTDGSELDVIIGAKRTIAQDKPIIIFEIGQYFIKERGVEFTDYFEFLNGYRLYNSSSLAPIDTKNYKKIIPYKSTIDIIAIPII